MDLFPTILAMAGINPPVNQGQDLLGWVRGGHAAPIHDAVFAQIGDYHGFIGTSWPSGMPASGRHTSLIHGIRTTERAYILDPDNGDEAYDLVADPNELRNLTNPGAGPLPEEFTGLKARLDAFTAECTRLRDALSVVPGDRGFVKGWE